jgi:DNA (cytosine-5)-methyltransferase 1
MLAIDPVSPSPLTADQDDATSLLLQVLDIYAARDVVITLTEAGGRDWSVPRLNRIRAGKSAAPALSSREVASLQALLPQRPAHYDDAKFQFVDLFAGIGGIRRGFEQIGGQCVFTSEWNKEAVRTYKANLYSDPQ